MAIDIQLKTIIELLFFALLLITAIYIFATFYNALFVSNNSLVDVKNRIEFTVCGGFTNIQEDSCPANQNSSHIYFFDSSHQQRIILFEKEGDILEADTINDINLYSTPLLGDRPTFIANDLQNPCDGPCVCQVDSNTLNRGVLTNECLELDFGDQEITIHRKIIQYTYGGLSNERVRSQNPVFIYPQQYSELFSSDIFRRGNKRLHLFTLYMDYDASTQQLLVTQYLPEESTE